MWIKIQSKLYNLTWAKEINRPTETRIVLNYIGVDIDHTEVVDFNNKQEADAVWATIERRTLGGA